MFAVTVTHASNEFGIRNVWSLDKLEPKEKEIKLCHPGPKKSRMWTSYNFEWHIYIGVVQNEDYSNIRALRVLCVLVGFTTNGRAPICMDETCKYFALGWFLAGARGRMFQFLFILLDLAPAASLENGLARYQVPLNSRYFIFDFHVVVSMESKKLFFLLTDFLAEVSILPYVYLFIYFALPYSHSFVNHSVSFFIVVGNCFCPSSLHLIGCNIILLCFHFYFSSSPQCLFLPKFCLFAFLDLKFFRTPPMGWMSWAKFYCETDCQRHPFSCINEKLYIDMADRLGICFQ